MIQALPFIWLLFITLYGIPASWRTFRHHHSGWVRPWLRFCLVMAGYLVVATAMLYAAVYLAAWIASWSSILGVVALIAGLLGVAIFFLHQTHSQTSIISRIFRWCEPFKYPPEDNTALTGDPKKGPKYFD